MPALITTLIDKVDSSELIRDTIAAILVTERAGQQELAALAGKDPQLWDFRVFIERSHPWSEFDQDAASSRDDVEPDVHAPIVSVSFETWSPDKSKSNVFERQQGVGIFNVDCYGYGVAEAEYEGGHTPGDQKAAEEAARAARLVRNTLMAAVYTYLGLRGTVAGRWVQTVTAFQPAIDGRTVQNVVAYRIAFAVEYPEFSPQVETEILEGILATVKRSETGEVFLTAEYDYVDTPELELIFEDGSPVIFEDGSQVIFE